MTALDTYIAPAARRTGIWWMLLGLLIIVGLWLLGTLAVLIGWVLWQVVQLGDVDLALQQMGAFMVGGTPLTIVLILATFGGIWLGVWLAMVAIHDQSFRTILAPDKRVHVRDLLLGIGLAVAFFLPSLVAALVLAEPYRTELTIGTWAVWLIPIVLLVFVQAGSEELIFRGYLLQQLGQISRHPAVWAGVPAVGFGLLHLFNLPGIGGVYYAAVTTLMGFSFAVLVWRSGNLWSAIGLHLGNNLLGIAFIGAEGPLAGMQFWLFPEETVVTLMPVDLAVSAVLLALLISPLGRIFGTGGKVV
ncbi:MAG: CPBP family intramembrane glutamic endopeptidase [Pseudomonadota bacterium]